MTCLVPSRVRYASRTLYVKVGWSPPDGMNAAVLRHGGERCIVRPKYGETLDKQQQRGQIILGSEVELWP
jgi:hypothetical protein